MYQRLKRAWKLSAVNDDLSLEKLEKIVDEHPEQFGDGKAEFLGEGTHEEFLEQEQEKKGLKNVFGIGL